MNPTDRLHAAKRLVWEALACLPGPRAPADAARLLAPDCLWVASHPVNELIGPQAVLDGWLAPLARALPDLERRTDLFFAGHWDGRVDGGAGEWVTCHGHYLGTFTQPLFGVPPTGEPVWLRFGEFYRVVDGQIAEARILVDVIDLARQAGFALLPPPTGQTLLVPGPRRHDGLLTGAPADGSACLQLVEAMIGGLGKFQPGADLKTMGMAAFWQPEMQWYGPCGIGSSRGIGGFERHHQKPFLTAFPDRKGGHHRARFGEGSYAASTGWPSIHATHAGPYLGSPASGQRITMRVMDWWREEGGLLAENWVLIDLPHLFQQFGVNLLAPLKR
jgi:predicted ester cyclase